MRLTILLVEVRPVAAQTKEIPTYFGVLRVGACVLFSRKGGSPFLYFYPMLVSPDARALCKIGLEAVHAWTHSIYRDSPAAETVRFHKNVHPLEIMQVAAPDRHENIFL